MTAHRVNRTLFSAYFLCILLFAPTALSTPTLPPINSKPTNIHIPGKFIWFELAANDPAQLKRFYGTVFGWQFQAVTTNEEQYTLIRNNKKDIAGLFKARPRKNVQVGALWIAMLSSSNLNDTVSKIQKSGGTLHTPPTALPDRGSYAIAKDPEGALFGLLKSDSGDPADASAATGDFIWLDLFAKDTQQAANFYKQLANYTVTSDDSQGANRRFLSSADKYRAGIVPRPPEANRSGWLPYVRVNDVNATLKKVEAAGGVVMVAPDKSLFDGNLAIFADPSGGILGIIKWDDPAGATGR